MRKGEGEREREGKEEGERKKGGRESEVSIYALIVRVHILCVI